MLDVALAFLVYEEMEMVWHEAVGVNGDFLMKVGVFVAFFVFYGCF